MEATAPAPRISFPAQTQCLERIRAFCRNILENHCQDQQIHRKVVLAIDEAVANVIEHACSKMGGKAASTIELTIEPHPDRIVVQILDHGAPFTTGSEGSPAGTRRPQDPVVELGEIPNTIPMAFLSPSAVTNGASKSRRQVSSFPRRGFGLQLIRLIMDEIDYQRTPQGENLLTLTKRLRKGVNQ